MADFKSIRNRYSLIDIASRYVLVTKEKAGANEFISLCPFHADTKPSLRFYQGSDGNWRYYCFACLAGDEGGDVIDFVAAIEGISLKEAGDKIVGNDMPDLGERPKREVVKSKRSEWTPIVPVPKGAPKYDPKKTYSPLGDRWSKYTPELITPYNDAEGKLLFYVIRVVFNKETKICPTVSYCEGPGGEKRWCARRPEGPYPLLGLHELATRPKDTVLIVSGEKVWDRISRELKNFVPVTWLGGDGSVNKADIEPLKGRWLVFSPDNDANGEDAMLTLFNRIEGHGTG